MFKEQVFEKNWLDRKLTIKTGKLAKQADASVLVQYGETVVMATVVQAKEEKPDASFFPLMVEFEERLYAAGIIKGSKWIKREGRPSDQSILTGRMIDRAIRPLFNDEQRKDVQVVLTVLSVDHKNNHDIVALVAASTALSISGVEWKGPIAGIRVGQINGEFVFNPTYEEEEKSNLDLIVAGTSEKVIMLEAGAKELPEEAIKEAILKGQEELQPVIELINEIKKTIPAPTAIEKEIFETIEEKEKREEKEKNISIAEKWLEENIKKMLFDKTYHSKTERKAVVKAIKTNLDKFLFEQGINSDQRKMAISKTAEKMIEAEVSRSIIEDGKRVDGRKLDEIRELTSEVGFLPRNHGTGLFSRGETQVMSILTLGAPGLEQSLEGLEGESTKRFMHHYNFPPYSVGEARPLRGTGRREVGHGALAEKALTSVIPSKEDFPYTIRIVSETLGSNGSSSMASTCGSSLALMDAGVPIKTMVGGIAMGLASNKDMSKWKVITDIQDLEDGEGGMDFKITGTKNGITAIQLDTKTTGINENIIEETLTKGRKALNQVLDVLNSAISEPRKELSKHAPKIYTTNINPEKIGMVIGPGGKVINKIIEETEASIDIEEDGLVIICGQDKEKCLQAKRMVEEIVHEFEPGETVMGKVVRLADFGAFVSLNGNQDGLVHVSEMAPYRVDRPENILKVGDNVVVNIKDIDDQGKIKLTMKNLPQNEKYWINEPGKMTRENDFHKSKPGFNNNRNKDRRFNK